MTMTDEEKVAHQRATRPWWYAKLDPTATRERCLAEFRESVTEGLAEMIVLGESLQAP